MPPRKSSRWKAVGNEVSNTGWPHWGGGPSPSPPNACWKLSRHSAYHGTQGWRFVDVYASPPCFQAAASIIEGPEGGNPLGQKPRPEPRRCACGKRQRRRVEPGRRDAGRLVLLARRPAGPALPLAIQQGKNHPSNGRWECRADRHDAGHIGCLQLHRLANRAVTPPALDHPARIGFNSGWVHSPKKTQSTGISYPDGSFSLQARR